MRRQDFQYQLPSGLIAQNPLENRGQSRLLSLDANTGEYEDGQFQDLANLLRKGDLLVFNDTRVIPARLLGHKESGGSVEVLVERILDQQTVLAHVRASKSPKPGTILILESDIHTEVTGRQGDLFVLKFPGPKSALEILEEKGHMPLPPYIQRADTEADQERYQTVYASKPGAVAAPTAGLHFDQDMLDRLKDKGVKFCFVTLHVGAGTFQPVRVDDITDHQMHSEYIEVSKQVCEQVESTRAAGGRVIAVGTTSVRCLESASRDNGLQPYTGETDIFIYPGYEFKSIDGMITNFHLSESTLLMLVCAFGGYDHVMKAYRHAIEEKYRFYSYGDAMYIFKESPIRSSLRGTK